MSVNFVFLHDALPSLEKFGELAETYLHTDPNGDYEVYVRSIDDIELKMPLIRQAYEVNKKGQ